MANIKKTISNETFSISIYSVFDYSLNKGVKTTNGIKPCELIDFLHDKYLLTSDIYKIDIVKTTKFTYKTKGIRKYTLSDKKVSFWVSPNIKCKPELESYLAFYKKPLPQKNIDETKPAVITKSAPECVLYSWIADDMCDQIVNCTDYSNYVTDWKNLDKKTDIVVDSDFNQIWPKTTNDCPASFAKLLTQKSKTR